MRFKTLAFAFAVGLLSLSGNAHAVCNARGDFCSYPAWASNAFAHPRDRVPVSVLEDNHRRRWASHDSGDRRRDRHASRKYDRSR